MGENNPNAKAESKGALGWIRELIPGRLKSTIKDRLPSLDPPGRTVELVEPSAESAATHVVFLPRDPQWAYCFWTISAADLKRAQKAGATQLCIRLADVTGLGSNQAHPHTLQEIVVQAGSSEWFMPVPLDNRDYRVELGYRLRSGGWYSLAFSSVAHVPGMDPSSRIADTFVPFSLDEPPVSASWPEPVVSSGVLHEQHYQRAAVRTRSRRVGSEVLHEQDFESSGLNDSGVGVWASGRNESGAGLSRERSFWLVADAELIVYGATDPAATLFIGDRQVPLESDGTFRMQVPFRDGEQVYPIRAVAADGEQERSIRLEFERSTPQARVNTREEAVSEWF
ncbi:DUF4912 domain-containing protein [Vulcanococcus sp.]|jgi:hypothetical protein|uniref:DUF4912 domain-containing protein n=1 Tax=Vulcanococcus sp. TaxID=2856995 RepID=UPI003BFEBAE8